MEIKYSFTYDVEMVNSWTQLRETEENKQLAAPLFGRTCAFLGNLTSEKILRYYEDSLLDNLPRIIDVNRRSRGIMLIKADARPVRKRKNLSDADIKYTRSLPKCKIKCVGNFYTVVGLPFMIRKNIDVSKGIANRIISFLFNIMILKTSA